MIDRNWLSRMYVRGAGIEIGAFHNPFPFNKELAQVQYVDKADSKTVLERHPDMPKDTRCVPTEIYADGETLEGMPDNQFDFVIASHMLEHCFSPLTAIENHVRVLKKGGHAIYALPVKDFTFDKDRQITELNCLIDDWTAATNCDPAWRRKRMIEHHYEYFRYVDKMSDLFEMNRLAVERIDAGLDIHYHAWDIAGIYDLFSGAREFLSHRAYFELSLFYPCHHEVFIVIKKA